MVGGGEVKKNRCAEVPGKKKKNSQTSGRPLRFIDMHIPTVD